MAIPSLAVRGSTGVILSYGPPSYEDISAFVKDEKTCRAMVFSPDGKYFAWISPPLIKIALCSTWKVVATIEKPKVSAIQFSPLGTYLTTWEPFIVSQAAPQGSPQLHVWRSENGQHVHSFTQKRQIDWEIQWSKDEKLCGLLINSDVLFYENSDFSKFSAKLNLSSKAAKFSIAPGDAPYHLACFVPGKTGQPSLVRIFQYPKLNVAEAIATKSFFQADRAEFYWNKTGKSVLALTVSDVDKTGVSYYGKQSVHYLNVEGKTSMVISGDDGSVHAVGWSPNGTEFCLTYGNMPSKTTLYNLKCETVFEFGKKHRNTICYNPQGNILVLGGFGNIQGNFQLWDVAKRKLIAEVNAPDTTMYEWSPDGEHFMTATTAPKLRTANGYKIWHYTGGQLYERPWSKQEELWQVVWQCFPPGVFRQKSISYRPVEGIASTQPVPSKEAYRPPAARGRPTTFKLHDDIDTTQAQVDRNPSKAALKAKKRREAKKGKKDADSEAPAGESNVSVAKAPTSIAAIYPDLTDDPEKNKKIKAVKKKLEAIEKLKEQLAAGKKLEINQQDKIKKETELLMELCELTL